MLAVAKCGGPHIEFQPGRLDAPAFDPPGRLPAPTEPLHHTVSGLGGVLCAALGPAAPHVPNKRQYFRH